MPTQFPVVRQACSSCSAALLRSFVAVASPELSFAARHSTGRHLSTTRFLGRTTSRASTGFAQRASVRRAPRLASRALSTARCQIIDLEADEYDDALAAKVLDSNATASTASGDALPWYLQQGNGTSSSFQSVAAGQEMPDMPEHAPDLLEPIVKHTLDTLGLTHFKILDLRQMTDPPPALGANLLMVIATARSERHLHASADKLCRWLRTQYSLSPFADGLLGRNEMKIAVRRRVKRAKMMSAVGAQTEDGSDIADGIRSDWICVNVGRVKGGLLPDVVDAETKREIVGFGTTNDSSTIVVQMMTEDKRTEIDLEDLWTRALRRQIKQKEALLQPRDFEEATSEAPMETSLADGVAYTPMKSAAA